MDRKRIAIAALFAAGVAAMSLSAAKAQYYPCNPFPLTWPFCAAGAVVGTAAAIATAPFRAVAGAPYYYYPPPPRYYYRRYHRYYGAPYYYRRPY